MRRAVALCDVADCKNVRRLIGNANVSDSGGRLLYGAGGYRAGNGNFRQVIHLKDVPIKFRGLAQLCGYDGNGREVYEGDKLSDQHGAIYTVELKGFAVTDDDIVPLDPDNKNLPRLLLIPTKE